MARPLQPRNQSNAPVLLLGAGLGEATCGILYVASYLRRHGIEVFVQLTDHYESEDALRKNLEQLVASIRPRIVGISLKWFHHVFRAKQMAEMLREIDPTIQIVLGGNSASFWRQQLLEWPCIDDIVLGDGEVPFLNLCRGETAAPNVVSRTSKDLNSALGYVQSAKSDEIHYSHFADIFLSQFDRHSFSGWVAPGKGCGENCLYCSGTRGLQKATFGRAKPFLRPVKSVQLDHREIAPVTWQLRYDFAGSTAQFLTDTWSGIDFSKHSTTYFLWGVPPVELAETLSRTFLRAHMVLDIGCFSESQRLEQMRRGVLKPCPTDEELFQVIENCQRFSNLQLEISGIAGLPYANGLSLKQERTLVQRVLLSGCSIGYQRLEAQPGALVTEHPERFDMVSEATSFDQFLKYFEQRDEGEVTVPMIRFANEDFERAVQETSDEIDDMVWSASEKKLTRDIDEHTMLQQAPVSRAEFRLGEWFGGHRVPNALVSEPVTVLRAPDGHGLTCAPTLKASHFLDDSLHSGREAEVLLKVFGAFEKRTSVKTALRALKKIDATSGFEVVDLLVRGGFLQ
jgi:B12 binding domain